MGFVIESFCSHVFFFQKDSFFLHMLCLKLKNDNFSKKKVEKRQFFGKKVEKRQFFRNNNCSPIKITVWLITSSNFLFCFIIKINKFNIYMLFLLCCCYFHLSWKNEEKKSDELQMTIECAGGGRVRKFKWSVSNDLYIKFISNRFSF